jgi:hypothetical protein
MRKIGLIAVAAALTLVGVGGWKEWVTSGSQARLATPTLESVCSEVCGLQTPLPA